MQWTATNCFNFHWSNHNKNYLSDKIKKNEMDSEYGTYKVQSGAYGVLVGNIKERDHLEGLGVGERILLK